MDDSFTSRAQQIQAHVLAHLGQHSCFSQADKKEAKVQAPVVVPKEWDDNFPKQVVMALHLSAMVLRDMQMVIYLGKGNPNRGFSVLPFEHIPDEQDRPKGMEHARYVGQIRWEGSIIDMDRVKSRKMSAPADSDRRAWQIKKYLKELDDERNGRDRKGPEG